MKRRFLVSSVLAIACLAFIPAGFGQWKPTISEDDRMRGSYRFERNGWIYVHLAGSPEQLGYQHGRLLAKETEDLLRVTRRFLEHETRRKWEFYRKASQDILWPKI